MSSCWTFMTVNRRPVSIFMLFSRRSCRVLARMMYTLYAAVYPQFTDANAGRPALGQRWLAALCWSGRRTACKSGTS